MIDDKTPEPPKDSPKASDLIQQAEGEGKLDKLQACIDDLGFSDISAGEMLLLAQKDDRTHGKSPDELADMLKADTSLYDDLEALKPGGKLDKPPVPPEEGGEPDGNEVAAMGEDLKGSASMKDVDPKKAAKFGKMPKDKGDLEGKMSFMKKNAPPFGEE